MEELLLAYVSKQFGLTQEAAADLLFNKSEEGELTLKDNALDVLLDKDKDRVSKLKVLPKEEKTKMFDDAYKKAKTEVTSKLEKRFREKYGVEDKELKLDALIAKIVADSSEIKLDEDAVKSHPLYLQLEKEKNDAVVAIKSEFETKLNDIEANQKRDKILSEVKSIVRTKVQDMNPILPKTKEVAETRMADFLSKFEAFDYEKVGEDFVLLKDGKRVEDEHGNAVLLSNYLPTVAKSNFEFQVQKPKGAPGSGTPPNVDIVELPKSDEEFYEKVLELATQEERDAYTQAYEATKS